jgi:hypothetical protein
VLRGARTRSTSRDAAPPPRHVCRRCRKWSWLPRVRRSVLVGVVDAHHNSQQSPSQTHRWSHHRARGRCGRIGPSQSSSVIRGCVCCCICPDQCRCAQSVRACMLAADLIQNKDGAVHELGHNKEPTSQPSCHVSSCTLDVGGIRSISKNYTHLGHVTSNFYLLLLLTCMRAFRGAILPPWQQLLLVQVLVE